MMGLGLDPRVWPGVVVILGLMVVAKFLRSRALFILLGVLLIAHAAFFRDMDPKVPGGDSVLSPGSGKVVAIDTVQEDRFLKEESWRIRIFLAVWNVHVTRSPMDGNIVYQLHVLGQHINALLASASQYNESNWIGIQKNDRRALVRQMTGAIARRVFSDVKEGNAVARGQKLGIICYGSSVELFLPKKVFRPTVRIGQRVKTGETVVGEWTGKTEP